MPRAAQPGANGDEFRLADHLSRAEMIALAEAYGGTRLYIPKRITGPHRLVNVLGLATSAKLVELFGGSLIRVPLLRRPRAQHFRAEGRSYGWIARRLCMTETAVEKMLRRSGHKADTPI